MLLTYEAKKLPYTTGLIDFNNKPEWLMATSGGKVPVIKEEGKDYMPDSDIITAHLEKEHPETSLASSVPPEMCVGGRARAAAVHGGTEGGCASSESRYQTFEGLLIPNVPAVCGAFAVAPSCSRRSEGCCWARRPRRRRRRRP